MSTPAPPRQKHAVNNNVNDNSCKDGDSASLLWLRDRLEDQARAKERAAVRIQARWRGKIGGIEGLAHLKVCEIISSHCKGICVDSATCAYRLGFRVIYSGHQSTPFGCTYDTPVGVLLVVQ